MKNTMLWTRCFSYIWFVSISRVLFPIARAIDIYLGCKLLCTSSDSPHAQRASYKVLKVKSYQVNTNAFTL